VVISMTTLFRSSIDEVAFWRSDETSANPDVEILRALRPGLASIPGSMLLIASSPYAKRGELHNAYRRHFGKDGARVLVWKAPTQIMNPSLDKAIIDEAYESDPEAARAEYGAEFRDDLADFVTREAVDAVTMWDRHELPPTPGVVYLAFCDPSGGVSDAMTLAIAHLDHNAICVLDAVLEVRPPFDPAAAVNECVALCRRYGVVTVTSDKYAGEWPVARFREHGVELVQSARPKSAIYQDLLPLLNERRVELLDLPRLSAQLTGLERRTARSGKDSIDHVPGGHDDVANAVAGALVMLDLDRRPALVNLKDVLGAAGDGAGPGRGLEPPACNVVFMVVSDAGPDIAAVFGGSSVNPDLPMPNTLYILDVDLVYFHPGLFGELASKLYGLGRRWGARTGIFAPEHLVARFMSRTQRADPLPKEFDAEQSLTLASDAVGRGWVKFCSAVTAKMQTRPIAAALALKAGDPVETALRAALVATIWLRYTRP
jgi:hypothetical protein